MEDWQERVIKEKEELSGKLGKLEKFMVTIEFDGLSSVNQMLLIGQLTTMNQYYYILMERIKRFNS